MPANPEPGPIGILGGTFDPVHFGHLRLAEEARQSLGLACVTLIPAGSPPHRGAPSASARHRLEMLRLATAGNSAFRIDEAETATTAPSYTVATLERLRSRLGPDVPLVVLLGTDAFVGLESWHRWRALFDLAHFGVGTRPGFELAEEAMPAALWAELASRRAEPSALRARAAGAVCPFRMTPLSISASAIRDDLARGASPRYLLADSVLDYIGRNQLYCSPMDGR